MSSLRFEAPTLLDYFATLVADDRHFSQIEAAIEFGGNISLNLGVASGGVCVMAGIYFRMEADAASLTGYFRLEGHVDVMGLITASLELYLELRYEFETGKAAILPASERVLQEVLKLLEEADCVIAVGASMGRYTTEQWGDECSGRK